MSATNRGAVRRSRDKYYSPLDCVRAIMRRLQICHSDVVIDPFAGDGRILRMATDEFGASHIGWDIEPDLACVDLNYCQYSSDSLSYTPWSISRMSGYASVIITNPPYSLAMPCVERCLVENPSGPTVMLLPLSFLASQKRAEFHKTHPCHLFVLSKRPSFTEDKKTDAVDYAYFAWNYSGVNGWETLEV